MITVADLFIKLSYLSGGSFTNEWIIPETKSNSTAKQIKMNTEEC